MGWSRKVQRICQGHVKNTGKVFDQHTFPVVCDHCIRISKNNFTEIPYGSLFPPQLNKKKDSVSHNTDVMYNNEMITKHIIIMRDFLVIMTNFVIKY